jgi:hypothetical protein
MKKQERDKYKVGDNKFGHSLLFLAIFEHHECIFDSRTGEARETQSRKRALSIRQRSDSRGAAALG